MSPTLVILAAGIGSRYGGLKQLDPVGPHGEIIMDYSLYDALRAGFRHVLFVIRRSIEKEFRQVIGRRFETRLQTDYVFQELDLLPPGFQVPGDRQKPWGTGHAVLISRERVTTPFAVINSDDFYGADTFRLLAEALRKAPVQGTDYTMVGFTLRQTLSEHGTVTRGICECDEQLYLRRIVETPKISKDGDGACSVDAAGRKHRFSGDEWVSMNAWGFTPTIFDHFEREFLNFLRLHGTDAQSEFFIPSVVGKLIAAGQARVRVLPAKNRWFGITHRDDKPAAEAAIRTMIANGLYPEQLWERQPPPLSV